MNIKKVVLYLLLGIILLIFAYNFLLLPSLYQNNYGMKMMGMHMSQYNSNSYFAYLIIIIVFIIALLIIVDYLFRNSSALRCKRCGMTIESDNWKVCPRCGNKLKD